MNPICNAGDALLDYFVGLPLPIQLEDIIFSQQQIIYLQANLHLSNICEAKNILIFLTGIFNSISSINSKKMLNYIRIVRL